MDGFPHEILYMKEPNYIVESIGTYGGLEVNDGQRESKREYEKDSEMQQKRFQYCEPFSNHLDFCHVA